MELFEEDISDKKRNTRQFLFEVKKLAKEYGCNFFIVSDGASVISNNGNKIIDEHRKLQIELDKKMGVDPNEDWSKEMINSNAASKNVQIKESANYFNY